MPDVITIVRAVYSGMSQRKVAQDVPGGVVPGETRPWRCGNGPGACGYERVDRGEPTGKVLSPDEDFSGTGTSTRQVVPRRHATSAT